MRTNIVGARPVRTWQRNALRSRRGKTTGLTAALHLVLAGMLGLLMSTAEASADANDAAIVVDGISGRVLYAASADEPRYPASLTKMMTLYIVFEELDRGSITLRTALSVSANAAAQPATRLGVRTGSTISVENAIYALITRSANDVAVVIAENLAHSAADFAVRMTDTARSIGMSNTTFRNPHGLPNQMQVTTARDMAALGIALHRRFPQYYHYFSTPSFTWRGTVIGNHNRLLAVNGVDGIKTGYTRASGYNLVTSVNRDGRYVVAVVMGGSSAGARDQRMRELISVYTPQGITMASWRAAMMTAPMPRPQRPEFVAVVENWETALGPGDVLPGPQIPIPPPNPERLPAPEVEPVLLEVDRLVVYAAAVTEDQPVDDVASIASPGIAIAELPLVIATADANPR